MDVLEYAERHGFVRYSAMGNKDFIAFFKNIRTDVAVEVGTYKGLGAAYIAQFANRVHTFDIVDYPEKYKVWYDLGVSSKISFHVVKSRYEGGIARNFEGVHEKNEEAVDIKSIIDTIDFDFAFVDGEHTGEEIEKDWELVKKCGRVLFHDVDPQRFPELNRFAVGIGTKITRNIGYWEAK